MPAREMNAQAISVFDKDVVANLDKTLSVARQVGSAIWQFPGNESRRKFMQKQMKDGVPVFVESDDNYLITTPGLPGFKEEWNLKQKGKTEITNRFTYRECVREVDGVIVSTPHLAEMHKSYNSNIHVCLNSISPEDWECVRKLDDDVIRVGYAFSTSHFYDFDYIWESLEWCAKQPGVEVVLIGFPMPRKLGFNRFRFVNIPWMNNHKDYRETLGILDVGLAPLKPGVWADGKSDLKAMEYAMAGSMTIASPVESYSPWFDQPCVFPEKNTPKEWLKSVKEVVSAGKDGIRDFAAEAKQYVLENRTIHHSIGSWREAIGSV